MVSYINSAGQPVGLATVEDVWTYAENTHGKPEDSTSESRPLWLGWDDLDIVITRFGVRVDRLKRHDGAETV